MKYRDENGDFQDLYFKTGDTLPIGTIVSYGSLTPPTNWLVCDGSAVSRTAYAALFAAIGTSYGSGDGSTTFNLPDLRGRVPVGKSTDTEFDTLGETGGEKTHTLTVNEMPEHTHTAGLTGVNEVAPHDTHPGLYPPRIMADYYPNWNVTGLTINNAGGGQAHNILQPYQVVCFIIKAEDAAGVVGNVTNTQNNSTKDTYSCDYINDCNSYSTSETFTGKHWINNKPIYRKVIEAGVITEQSVTQAFELLSNVDVLIDAKAFTETTYHKRLLPLIGSASTLYIDWDVDKQTHILTLNTLRDGTVPYSYANIVCIVEYTKTTDSSASV